MTAQSADKVTYRGKTYSVAGKKGNRLFKPTAHGLKPAPICSGCWRGFVCSYAVEGERLVLDSLLVWLKKPGPPLFGVPPKPHHNSPYRAVYEGLSHPVPFTGGLLVAADFIEDLYVHMGFHPAWKYREVHELVFRNGALTRETDRSAQIAEFRRELADRPLQPGLGAKVADLKRWIVQCFSQEYRW